MRLSTYFKKMNKNAYHNLCTSLSPPPGISSLLGLGLKFCIKTPAPQKDSLDKTFERFRRDVRLKFFFADTEDVINDEDFNPHLYIKSDWIPPEADGNIEDRMTTFQKKLTSTRNNIILDTCTSSNLTL